MITVDNTVATTDEQKEKERKRVIVYNFKIADQLLQLGYKMVRILKDKKHPDKNYPVYVFENEKEIVKMLDALSAKAKAERENKEEKTPVVEEVEVAE